MITTHHGDCVDVLGVLPPSSVQCIVTSPPYFGLRDYGLPPTLWPTIEYTPLAGLPSMCIQGCDPDCAHVWGSPVRGPFANTTPGPNGRMKNTAAGRDRAKEAGNYCQLCGGWRGCLGLEPDPHMFIAHLVHVFRLVRTVLSDDGTAWVNLGDTYAAGGNGVGGSFMAERMRAAWEHRADRKGYRKAPDGLKEKDLLGIPWRLAFALQADGWYLRSDVIWAKPNAMPESIKDRPTKAHEYIFLLAKNESYYYDQAAIAEPSAQSTQDHAHLEAGAKRELSGRQLAMQEQGIHGKSDTLRVYDRQTRNRRTVWTISSQGIRDAHFATFPEALVEPCILAGSRPGDTVLDMFAGSGTVLRVAERLQRDSIGIDLNADYIELQQRRTNGVQVELFV